MRLTGKRENGDVITSLETWFEHAPPKEGANQWKDYRSAKELARAWLRPGQVLMPEEFRDMLSHRVEMRGFNPSHAVAEMEIRFDEFDGPRNADLVLWGRNAKEEVVVITVEAKADEEFSLTIGEKLDGISKGSTSNIPERVERLTQGILGKRNACGDQSIRKLRYQLFPALAATATLAAAKKARLGVLVIHELISLKLDFDKFTRNANDLSAFIHAIRGWECKTLKAGQSLPPIRLPGSSSVPGTVNVSIGKVRTLIP